MAKSNDVAVSDERRSPPQRSIRLYDKQQAIMGRWQAKLSPNLRPDFNELLREVLELTEFAVDLDIDDLKSRREAIRGRKK